MHGIASGHSRDMVATAMDQRRTRDITAPLESIPHTPAIDRQLADDNVIVLRCRRDGSLRVPLFQFRDGQADPEVVDAWSLMVRAVGDPWEAAVWFESPQPALSGRSPADFLRHGGSSEALMDLHPAGGKPPTDPDRPAHRPGRPSASTRREG